MQKLILGTASFGSIPYGIKGDGLVSEQELEKIARIAWDGRIRTIHLKSKYHLSKYTKKIFDDFEFIDGSDDPFFIWNEKKGISVYRLNEWNTFSYKIEWIQCPLNILDKSNFIEISRFVNEGHKIIARSVFLQGLLLMDTKDLPLWVNGAAFKQIHRFWETCYRIGLQPYEACLGYVLGLKEIDHVIVGVNSAKQLEQLLAVKPMIWEYDFSIDDENILDPRRWPK